MAGEGVGPAAHGHGWRGSATGSLFNMSRRVDPVVVVAAASEQPAQNMFSVITDQSKWPQMRPKRAPGPVLRLHIWPSFQQPGPVRRTS